MTSKFQTVALYDVNQSNNNKSLTAAYLVADVLEIMCRVIVQYPPVAHIWIGPLLFIGVTDPKHIEVKRQKYYYIFYFKIHNFPCVSLTTHIHIVPRLRISGAILPLPHVSSEQKQRSFASRNCPASHCITHSRANEDVNDL